MDAWLLLGVMFGLLVSQSVTVYLLLKRVGRLEDRNKDLDYRLGKLVDDLTRKLDK